MERDHSAGVIARPSEELASLSLAAPPAGQGGLFFRVSSGEHPNAMRYLRLKSAMWTNPQRQAMAAIVALSLVEEVDRRAPERAGG